MEQDDRKIPSANLHAWKEEHIGWICLDRPQKANAYNQEMLEKLGLLLQELECDKAVASILLCSGGDQAFCGGADRDEMQGKDYEFALHLKSARLFAQLAASRKVTMAVIQGAAVGGGLELALACDLRIASENARFFFPEPTFGLIPAAGGTQRLARIVGVAHAKELILGGKTWNAQEALRFGLLSEIVNPDELLPRARQWATEIAKRSPLALELAKKAIDLESNLSPGFTLEGVSQALLYQLQFKNAKERPLYE